MVFSDAAQANLSDQISSFFSKSITATDIAVCQYRGSQDTIETETLALGANCGMLLRKS